MIREWVISNFKSFKDERSLEFAPLTLICGANSTGKSTVIQSILLIKQTLQHSPAVRPIALNGPLVRLGVFNDIKNQTATQDADAIINNSAVSGDDNGESLVTLGWTIDEARNTTGGESGWVRISTADIKSAHIRFSFDAEAPRRDLESAQIQPTIKFSQVDASISEFDGTAHRLLVTAQRSSKRGRKPKYDSITLDESSNPFEFLVQEIDSETKVRVLEKKPDARLIGCAMRHFFPDRMVVRYDRSREIAKEIACRIAAIRTPSFRRINITGFLIPNDIVKFVFDALKAGSQNSSRIEELQNQIFGESGLGPIQLNEWMRKFSEIPPIIRRSFNNIISQNLSVLEEMVYANLSRDITVSEVKDDLLNEIISANYDFFRFSLSYLGPLRDEPKAMYPLQALASPTDVGIKGELTAAVLNLNEKVLVEYVPSRYFSEDVFKPQAVRARLKDAVTDWLQYLGVAVDFETTEKGKFGHDLRVRTNKSTNFQDLTNVGVGVSQVLPIVVHCILASPGSTIILEQPELHLHPAVQARLADFFVSMIYLKKQCISETHGEYLVERLRYRIVNDRSNTILDNTKIYFFEQKDGATACRSVPLTRFGAIEDWPDDFFDQSQKESERIVMSAMARRREERAALRNEDGKV